MGKELLQVTDARTAWEQVRDVLAECLVGADDRIEDIYAGLIDGRYTLLTTDDGVAVVTIQPIANRGVKEMLIICAHNRGNGGAMQRYQDQFDLFARRSGAVRVRLATRHEWLADALPEGWRPLIHEYVRDL